MKKYYPILPTVLVYKIFEYKMEFELAQKKEDEVIIFKKLIDLYPDIPDDYIQELELKMYHSLSIFGKSLQKYKEKDPDEKNDEFRYNQRIEQEKEILYNCIDNFDKISKTPIKIGSYDDIIKEEDIIKWGIVNFFNSYIQISSPNIKIEKVNKDNRIVQDIYIKIFDYNEYNIYFKSVDFVENITIVDEDGNYVNEIQQYETAEKNIYWSK